MKKKITQEKYDALPIIDGWRKCPGNTDYSLVSEFGNYALFGNCVRFGNYARFGNCVRFGNDALFGNDARFGNYTRFGNDAQFGNYTRFGNDAQFGNDARFEGKGIALDASTPFLSFTGFGSRHGSCTYFFNLDTGIFVRCGCFLGTADEFEKAVSQKYGESHEYHDLIVIVKKKFKQE